MGPDGQWRELVLGLLDAGEVLIDDVLVVQDPDGAAVQLVQDPGFDVAGAPAWRRRGTHRHSALVPDPDDPMDTVLHLVATGSSEHMHNHVETTFAAGQSVQNGVEYEVSYRARWLSGSNQLNTRLYFNRLARTTRLALPDHAGTPGAASTVATEELGPAFERLAHDPIIPGVHEPVTVSIGVADPEGVASVTLWAAVDDGQFASHPMAPSAAGRYAVTLPGPVSYTHLTLPTICSV